MKTKTVEIPSQNIYFGCFFVTHIDFRGGNNNNNNLQQAQVQELPQTGVSERQKGRRGRGKYKQHRAINLSKVNGKRIFCILQIQIQVHTAASPLSHSISTFCSMCIYMCVCLCICICNETLETQTNKVSFASRLLPSFLCSYFDALARSSRERQVKQMLEASCTYAQVEGISDFVTVWKFRRQEDN